jgi:hypothetical protein
MRVSNKVIDFFKTLLAGWLVGCLALFLLLLKLSFVWLNELLLVLFTDKQHFYIAHLFPH